MSVYRQGAPHPQNLFGDLDWLPAMGLSHVTMMVVECRLFAVGSAPVVNRFVSPIVIPPGSCIHIELWPEWTELVRTRALPIMRWPWDNGMLAVYGDRLEEYGHPTIGPVGDRRPIQGWKMRATAASARLDDGTRLRLHVEPAGRVS